MTEHFGDRLFEAVERSGSILCVGIDPEMDKIPMRFRDKFRCHCFAHPYGREAAAIVAFAKEIIDAVAQYAVAVKPNTGFFEQYGAAGIEALEVIIAYAKEKGLIVITDAKRGDGGPTAVAYADAHIGLVRDIDLNLRPSTIRADAVTVNPYIGDACLDPFVETAKANGTGVFIVAKTSFKPNSFVEQLEMKEFRGRVWESVADHVRVGAQQTIGQSGYSNIGVVLGATYPDDAPTMRGYLPSSWFLVSGFQAQGATAEDAVQGANPDGTGALVNSGSAIIFAPSLDEVAYRARQAKAGLNMALVMAGKQPSWM